MDSFPHYDFKLASIQADQAVRNALLQTLIKLWPPPSAGRLVKIVGNQNLDYRLLTQINLMFFPEPPDKGLYPDMLSSISDLFGARDYLSHYIGGDFAGLSTQIKINQWL